MNKILLIRHIKGTATAQEREPVVSWIDQSVDNKMYYIKLMNLVISENVSRQHPDGESVAQGMKSDAYREIMSRIETANEQNVDAGKKTDHDKESLQIKSTTKRLNGWKWASCTAVVLLCVSMAVNWSQLGENRRIVAIHKIPAVSDMMSTYYTDNGVKGKVVLPDSSIVWLNSGSKITYPKEFESDKRRISFEGEGYFEVVKNPEWPMEVVTPKGMKVEVLGTTFHLKSYNNDMDEQTTLFSGRVDISKSAGSKTIIDVQTLRPRESIKFTEQGGVIRTSKVDTAKTIAWQRGELLFEDTPMPEVIKILERWHGVDIIVQDPTILSCRFTASFASESIVQIMELLHFTSLLDYVVDGNKVYIKSR